MVIQCHTWLNIYWRNFLKKVNTNSLVIIYGYSQENTTWELTVCQEVGKTGKILILQYLVQEGNVGQIMNFWLVVSLGRESRTVIGQWLVGLWYWPLAVQDLVMFKIRKPSMTLAQGVKGKAVQHEFRVAGRSQMYWSLRAEKKKVMFIFSVTESHLRILSQGIMWKKSVLSSVWRMVTGAKGKTMCAPWAHWVDLWQVHTREHLSLYPSFPVKE